VEAANMPEGVICFVELMFGVGMFVNAVLFIPQAVKVYRTKKVGNLSLLMFAGFNVVQIFAILHGYIHSDYILMFGFLLSFMFSGAVTFMIMLYGNRD
jgi:MtN3 and saliva related transmembrane protein